MSDAAIKLSAAAAIGRVKSGDVSGDELFSAYQERIRSHDGKLGAFLWTADGSGESAGPLAGVPLAVKDLFCTEGVPTTAGSRILEGHKPLYTATAVRRLAAAGAPMIGKTNMDEFAMGSSNENSGYGIVRNPWDRERVPGGSSGGSAAAVAAGLAPWAIGTDTGGSIRQPAALCGIVGLKPTYGAVSRYGMVAFASSLDQCGPLTRTVTDAALLLEHLVGHDPCDSTSLGLPEPVRTPTRTDLHGLRFGVPAELGSSAEGVEEGVGRTFDQTLELIERLGGELVEVGLPHARHGIAAYYVIAPAEASSNLARYDGVRYGRRAGNGTLLDLYEQTRAEGFGDEVKRRIMLGTFALSAGYYDAYYGRAQRVRTKIADDFRASFESCDLIVTPTSPTVAFKLGERTADPLAMYLSDYCTVPMSLAGIPAISIPAGLAMAADGSGPERGLPVGFQIAGPAFSENLILDAAHALEQAIGFDVTGSVRMTPGKWEPVIGLEIHVQLSTRTKMFCACALSFGEPPNTRTCPVCLGHPGTLPTLNAQAVHYGLMIAMALECEIAPRSIFHRKNYFYPDLPKGYQISQYDIPLASSGALQVPGGPPVRIHRAHLEEDAAKLIHLGESGRIHGAGASVVDFNRGGTPLVEIVTEPDLRTAADARAFAQLLRTTLKQIGVSDVNMEEGSLRVDANVSVRPAGSDELRTKTELKNMNSFRFLERGVEAEIARQIEIWESGGTVVQETIHFDPVSGSLTALRSKEEVHDYRYFPEPDLVPVVPTDEMLERARAELPELPSARLERYQSEYGLPGEVAGTLVGWSELGSFFEESVAAGNGNASAIAQWTTGELVAFLREHGIEDPRQSKLSPGGLAELVGMVESRTLSRSAAKEVLAELTTKGGDPAAIVESKGLAPIADSGELDGIVERAIEENPALVERIRGGKPEAAKAIVGAVMRETKGRADGAEVNRLIKEKLGI